MIDINRGVGAKAPKPPARQCTGPYNSDVNKVLKSIFINSLCGLGLGRGIDLTQK